MLSSLTLLHTVTASRQWSSDFLDRAIKKSKSVNIQIKYFIPVRIQCLLDHRGRTGLFTIHSSHSEGIRKAYNGGKAMLALRDR